MANIKINSIATRAQYSATGAQTVFSYTFPIKADADLKVYQRLSTAVPNDALDILTLTTDYTVTGANTAGGGTIVLVVAAALGDIVTIVGDKVIDREAIYDQSVTLKKADLNNDFNNLTMFVKQIETKLDQLTPSYNRSALVGPDNVPYKLVLPLLAASEIWRGTATGIEAFPIVGELVAGPAVSTTGAIALWADTTGDLLQNSAVRLVGTDFTPTAAGTVIGIDDTSAFQLPIGTTAQEPSSSGVGMLRYNSDNSDTEVYEDGAWRGVLNSGTGAPVSATYIVQTPSTALTNEQALSSLATGLVQNTTTTGVLSIAVAGTDYLAPAAIGVTVQAFDATLTSLALLGTAADKYAYTTGVDTWAEGDITSFARTVLDDSDAATARATLGVSIGSDVQAYDEALLDLAALTGTGLMVLDGVDSHIVRTIQATANETSVGDGDGVAANPTIGLADNPIVPGSEKLRLPIGTTAQRPTVPNVGDMRYNNDNNKFEAYEDGNWLEIITSGSGAPIDATYIVQTSNSTLTNEQILGDLATGLVLNTTATGVLSIAAAGTDYLAPAAIGVTVQAFDATLTSLGALGTAADKYAYTTGVDTWAEADITSFARTLLDDADAVTARATLGAVIGTDVQAQSAELQQIDDLVDPDADRILFWDDSAGAYAYLSAGTNLTITGTTIDATGGGGAADAVTSTISQVAHGFSVGQVVRLDGASYVLAQASSAANAETVGVVVTVTDVDNFIITTFGKITGLSGLTAGEVYFLSATVAGDVTLTAPSTVGQVVKPVLIADTTTTAFVRDFRGNVLANAADGGSVSAWLTFVFTAGVPTILDSFNISSLTDNGVGDMTANFSVSFANSDFAVACALNKGTGSEGTQVATTARTASSLRTHSGYLNSAAVLVNSDTSFMTGARSIICVGTQ